MDSGKGGSTAQRVVPEIPVLTGTVMDSVWHFYLINDLQQLMYHPYYID